MRKYDYFYYEPTTTGKYRLRMKMCLVESGRVYFEYQFKAPNGQVLFEGNDFSVPVRNLVWSYNRAQCSNDLMSFLTLRPGDTDDEYFEHYTPEQLAFANSFDCECLQGYTIDWDVQHEKKRKE